MRFPFHIPHIYHSITDSLSFADLLKCILVNRQWHDAFIPILWSDVVTFRTKLPPWPYEEYHDYSLNSHTRRGLFNHARYIHALTCQGFQSLRILFDSSCVNLVEINFMIDLSTGCPGLDDLVDLMSVSPILRAVSIENVDLDDKVTKSQFQDLLEFLDDTPSITNVALVPLNKHLNEELWEAVWARLCSRVDFSTIHSLCIHTSSLSRSERAPTSRRSWPGRESPISAKVGAREYRRALPSAGGRWENERRMQDRRHWCSPCVAVLENDGCLELCAAEDGHRKPLLSFLQRSPTGWSIGDDDGSEQSQEEVMDTLGPTIRQVFPNLCKLNLPRQFLSSLPQEQFLPTLAGLSLSFGHYNTNPVPLSLSAHSGILLSLECGFVSTSDFFAIVTNCPNLQDLQAIVRYQLPGPEVSPPWICKNLRKLDIRFIHREEEDWFDFSWDSDLERVEDSARRLAPSVLRQLGTLSKLQDLCIEVNNEYRVTSSPFFQLSLDPDYGLPQLAGVQQLKTFKVTGLIHSVGQTEIEWMKTYWPFLLSLEIPILTDVKGKRTLVWRDYFEGHVPAYENWYPGLNVLIPESCYGCIMCRYLHCEFDSYGDDDYDHIGAPEAVEPVDMEAVVEDMDWEEYEREETVWALDSKYHLSRQHHVHTSACSPKFGWRRQMRCGNRH
ncbi:hypothetical protein CPB97_005457 [Podila verticillata]|nr:hypothetical protein CPB97_005457 [Podila verticillata]